MPDTRFYKAPQPISLAEVARISGAFLVEDAKAGHRVSGLAPIQFATDEDVTFLSNPRYADTLMESKAGACFISDKQKGKAPESMALLVSDNPYAAYARLAAYLYPEAAGEGEVDGSGIHPSAYVDSNARVGRNCFIGQNAVIEAGAEIGDNTSIGAGSYIGKGVVVGNHCRIAARVTITHALLGNKLIIHPGVCIGQDGFGFAFDAGQHRKVPQLGRVIIENNVEIGAGTCIDRGTGPDTVIGQGTKIDNLVQIGHNVQIGKHCVIVSQVGIAGSTKLQDYVVLGGQVGLAGHITIGAGANIAAQSGVIRDVAPKETMGGSPAVPVRQWHRQNIVIKKLTERKDG